MFVHQRQEGEEDPVGSSLFAEKPPENSEQNAGRDVFSGDVSAQTSSEPPQGPVLTVLGGGPEVPTVSSN